MVRGLFGCRDNASTNPIVHSGKTNVGRTPVPLDRLYLARAMV